MGVELAQPVQAVLPVTARCRRPECCAPDLLAEVDETYIRYCLRWAVMRESGIDGIPEKGTYMSLARRLPPRGAAVLLIALVMVLVAALPASAHFVSIYHGADNAWTANNDHTIWVYDHENDGHLVYVQVELTQYPWSANVWDGYGGGGNSRLFAGYIDRFRLCEQTVSCTAWYAA